jgi:hypothetical protein
MVCTYELKKKLKKKTSIREIILSISHDRNLCVHKIYEYPQNKLIGDIAYKGLVNANELSDM